MTTEYVSALVSAYSAIREVWLYGSRANETARPDSDWDYLAFADEATLVSLSQAGHAVSLPGHRFDGGRRRSAVCQAVGRWWPSEDRVVG
jgi:Polymerase beta, Nucleotidyltransferase